MEGNDCPRDTKKMKKEEEEGEEMSDCEELSFFVQELLSLESTRNNKNDPCADVDKLIEMMSSIFFFKFLQTATNQRSVSSRLDKYN